MRRLLLAIAVVAIAGALAPGLLDTQSAIAAPRADLITKPAAATITRGEALDIEQAAKAATWPATVVQAVDDQENQLPVQWVSDHCLRLHTDTESASSMADRCTFGSPDATHTAVLFGDSMAIAYYPALRRALSSKEWRITILTAEQCPANSMTVVMDDGSDYPGCDAYRAWALGRIAAMRPDLVVTASSYSALWRWKAPAGESDSLPAWADGARTTVSALARAAKKVLVLDAPEFGPQLGNCLTRIAGPAQCDGAVSDGYVNAVTTERQALTPLLRSSRVLYPRTVAWYCTADGICPSFVHGEPTLADGVHPSTLDAARIGLFIRRALTTTD
ncbi:SGNH hydrolase domain-containing protein [Amnibacterium kyonggiense]